MEEGFSKRARSPGMEWGDATTVYNLSVQKLNLRIRMKHADFGHTVVLCEVEAMS